jgi:aryl-alcohol dehydrogenase-like predicted oxidoreductase
MSQTISRRGFLGTGLAVAAAVPAGAAAAKNPLPFNPRTHAAMPVHNLGGTGYRVGILSLGGQATLEIPGREEEAQAIIHKAIDLGINYLDSAAGYGNGTSERYLGMVLKARRKEAFITSKTDDRTYDGSMRLLERTLKSMQTDHLDLWQIHNLQTQEELRKIFAPDGAIKALENARDQGMTSFVGVTGHYEPNVLVDAIRRYRFDTLLLAINAADRHYLSFIEHVLPVAEELKMGTISMKVATRGRVLKSWTPPPAEQQPERMRTQLPGTLSIEEALSYNLSLPVSTTIIGVDSVAQIEQNVKFASSFTPLSEAQMRDLEKRTLPIVRQALYFRRWNLGA